MAHALSRTRPSLFSRLWFRGRFYLSGLILILPMIAFPFYFREASAPPLGANILAERTVGPYRLTLAEQFPGGPRIVPGGEQVKDYQLEVAEGYPDRIRSIYIRVGQPTRTDDLGDVMHGSPYRLHAHVPVPHDLKPDDRLWLTLEDWDGTLRQVSWPVSEAMKGAMARRTS